MAASWDLPFVGPDLFAEKLKETCLCGNDQQLFNSHLFVLVLLSQFGCKSNRWQTFSDSRIGFEMLWQPRWSTKWIEESGENHLVFSLAKSKDKQVAISVIKHDGKIPIEAALAATNMFGADVQKEIIKVAGRRASRVEGILKDSDAHVAMYQLNGEEANYTLQCYVAPSHLWEEYGPTCAKVVSSFHLTAEREPVVISQWQGPLDLSAAKVAYEKKEYPKALAQLKALADKNNAQAQYLLGQAYAQGRGVEQNLEQAAYWYQKSADSGYVDGQSSIGAYYLSGISVPKDFAKAQYWLSKAAQQGSASAMNNLGFMYSEGKGLEQNYVQAANWFQKAAKNGYGPAHFQLGKLYAEGHGVKRDPTEAYFWLQLSTLSNYTNATSLRDQIARTLKSEQIKKIQARASRWRPAKST